MFGQVPEPDVVETSCSSPRPLHVESELVARGRKVNSQRRAEVGIGDHQQDSRRDSDGDSGLVRKREATPPKRNLDRVTTREPSR